MSLLEVRGISVSYDTVPVLLEASIDVGADEIVAVLGGNGAGKTTLLRAISGLVPLASGTLAFEDRPLEGIPEHDRVALGIAHVPVGQHIFASLTVMENLRLGGHVVRRNKKELMARMDRTLAFFPALAKRRSQAAYMLSGGQQQMLAIARGLMSNPRLLMVDEASWGLAPAAVESLFQLLREIHRSGIGLLLVEQNARAALEIADRAYVLADGRVVFDGPGALMLKDPRLVDTYLGGELPVSNPGAPPRSHGLASGSAGPSDPARKAGSPQGGKGGRGS